MAFQNNSQYDDLIKQAGRSVGANPNELKQSIDSGKLDDLLKKMRPADAAKFQQIVNNPQLSKQLLNTPQAQALIKKFLKQ